MSFRRSSFGKKGKSANSEFVMWERRERERKKKKNKAESMREMEIKFENEN